MRRPRRVLSAYSPSISNKNPFHHGPLLPFWLPIYTQQQTEAGYTRIRMF